MINPFLKNIRLVVDRKVTKSMWMTSSLPESSNRHNSNNRSWRKSMAKLDLLSGYSNSAIPII